MQLLAVNEPQPSNLIQNYLELQRLPTLAVLKCFVDRAPFICLPIMVIYDDLDFPSLFFSSGGLSPGQ